jgi:hypothetical protein
VTFTLYASEAEADAVAADLVADHVGDYQAEPTQDDCTGEFLGWAVVQRDPAGGYLSRWPEAPQ